MVIGYDRQHRKYNLCKQYMYESQDGHFDGMFGVFHHAELDVCSCDCDNNRQPEMAIWPTKPEILISPEL